MNGVLKVSKLTIAMFILPCLLLYAAIVFLPIALSFYYSTTEWNDPVFWPSFKRTMLFVLFSVIEIPFALFLAMLLSRVLRKPNFLISSYFLPVILSVAVVGQLWKSIYNPASLGGMLNKILLSLGLDNWALNWLTDPNVAIYAIIFVALWQYLGYHVLIQFTGVQNIPSDIYEAAKIDGAEGLKADWLITLPLVMPVFKISIVLAVIGSLKAFDTIIVMTGGGPANSTDVISTYMYNLSFQSYKYGYGSAISAVLVVLCLVFTILINLIFKRAEKSVS